MTFSKLAVVGLSVFALGGSVALAGDASVDRAQLAASSAQASKPTAPEGCGACCAKTAKAAPATFTDRG